MGAWIEIHGNTSGRLFVIVAPYMGAWIEISNWRRWWTGARVSLPTWERGLKFEGPEINIEMAIVAPYMGAWIEIAE